jgi:two-component system KDP operon response regulator KdpE
MADPVVVLIEDELPIRRFLRVALVGQGYRVFEVGTGEDGLIEAASRQPDAVILDLGLPDIDGLQVIRRLREWSAVPIVVLSARGQERDKVEALDAGADDYVSKPFGVHELLARVRAQVRRDDWHSMTGEEFSFGDVVVRLQQRLVLRKGRRVALSAREFELLRYLFAHRNEVVSREQLLRDVWGYSQLTITRTVDNYVAKLRMQLEPKPHDPRYLVTVHGTGYQLLV